jgi:hypothetical protein
MSARPPAGIAQSSIWTMPGCRITSAARASAKNLLTWEELADASGRRTLIAAFLSITWCSARYASPIPPAPSFWTIR